jgi:hypothetical protein
MPKKRATAFPDEPWNAFASRHSVSRLPTDGCLYSLSEPIIDAIKHRLPEFFDEQEETFERDLARTASFGFFYGRALGRSTPAGDGVDPLDERQQRNHAKIQEMLAEELRKDGATASAVDKHFAAGGRRREAIESRKSAYTGWLVTNLDFRQEVKRLKKRWNASISKSGGFPRHPHWLSWSLETAKFEEELDRDFQSLYRRWGLLQMLTWEWPIPLEPDLVGGVIENQSSETGVVLFLPWYLLRGERISVQEIIRADRDVMAPVHLRQWVSRSSTTNEDLGDHRFDRLAWLYRFRELALRGRYLDRCYRKESAIDLAFAPLLERDVETVRQSRLQLQRMLRLKSGD